MDTIDEADLLRVQLADSEVARCEAQLAAAKLNRDAVRAKVAAKYQLGPGDSINPETRAIVRASKEAAP
jgi:hypothetical protein